MRRVSMSSNGEGIDIRQVVQGKLTNILDLASSEVGVHAIENELEDFLGFILNNIHHRATIASELADLVEVPREGSTEIISFTMHTLRWREVYRRIMECMRRPKNPSHIRLYEAMLASYEDNWADRDLYRKYST